jgi:hypothetical protein
MYDQLADRWVVTQFSLPKMNTAGGPSFQCVAVSKTPDPTGAYWLYDFKYNFSLNDYGKFGVWHDGYYATFNLFDRAGTSYSFKGTDFCVYDRAKMIAGQTATQQCFLQPLPANYVDCPTDGSPPPVEPFVIAGALPVSLDGNIRRRSAPPATSRSSTTASARRPTTRSTSGRCTSTGRRRATASSARRMRSRSRTSPPPVTSLPRPGLVCPSLATACSPVSTTVCRLRFSPIRALFRWTGCLRHKQRRIRKRELECGRAR